MRFSFLKKKKQISKELHESGCQEAVTCGYDASKDLESPCSGDVSHGEVKIEETDGSCSGAKSVRPPCPCLWKHVALKLSTMATQYWVEGA